jgi:hypothetical protein
MMVVCGLVGMGALAAAMMVENNHKAQQKFKNTSTFTVDAAQVQSLMAKLAGNGLLNDFIHLPIPVACATAHTDGPCIRTTANGSDFVNITADPGGAPPNNWFAKSGYHEFYRDHDGVFSAAAIPTQAEDINSEIQRTTPVNIDHQGFQTGYYTTWRLVDLTSQPVVLLSRAHITAGEFTFDYDYDASTDTVSVGSGLQATLSPVADPTARTAYFAAADGTAYGIAKTELQNWAANGGLLLVYNKEDPSQYFIQKVNAITWKDTPQRVGFELQPVQGGSSDLVDKPAGPSPSFYPLETAMGYPAGVTWGGAPTLSATKQGAGWGTTPQNFYLFPSELASFSRQSGSPNFGVGTQPFTFNGSGVDVHRLAFYFYNMGNSVTPGSAPFHNHKPKLVAVPIVVTSLYLGAGIAPVGCETNFPLSAQQQTVNASKGCPLGPFYSLRMKTLPEVSSSPETVLISRLADSARNGPAGASDPATGFVTIARQIGTGEVRVIIK